jgi:hypothetical protein
MPVSELGVSVRLRVPVPVVFAAPVLPFVVGVPVPWDMPAAPVPGVFVVAFVRAAAVLS